MSDEYFVIKKSKCLECGTVKKIPDGIFGEGGTITTIDCGKCKQGFIETQVPIERVLSQYFALLPLNSKGEIYTNNASLKHFTDLPWDLSSEAVPPSPADS